MTAGQAPVEAIVDHLRRHPADRYPLEHAAGQFHLGVALTDEGRVVQALAALEVAVDLFDREGRAVEAAKAGNALGAALRLGGRPREAAAVFEVAADAFAEAQLPAERGAALYNLGVVLREEGDDAAARDALVAARAELADHAAPTQAAAASRELGATLLALGEADAAREALEAATELARRAGDPVGLGAAANALGLAHLAAGRPQSAVEALATAVAQHPRGLRPDLHAMALANLALAEEQAGDELAARVAARQALGVPQAPEPVRAQAAATVDRLGPRPDDVLTLLDREPRDRWPSIVRGELAWWLDAGEPERRRHAAAWVEGQARRPGAGQELAATWLEVVMEIPEAGLRTAVRAVVAATLELDEETAATFRHQVARALPRFHLPQWERLQAVFADASRELGADPGWD